MTQYYAAYVWNGSLWTGVGAQIPNIPAAVPLAQVFGSSTQGLTSGIANKTITFPSQTFGAIPQVFVQVTGTVPATILVTNTSINDFTISFTGTGNGTVTFNWMAVQPRS